MSDQIEIYDPKKKKKKKTMREQFQQATRPEFKGLSGSHSSGFTGRAIGLLGSSSGLQQQRVE
jgi:hypothetical protein